MVTMVGKEADVIDLFNSLIELDYDAIEAYDAAISRLENDDDKYVLNNFKRDHQRHVDDLTKAVIALGGKPATEADMKSVLTKGKVVLAGLMGDNAILAAMKSNEEDTNTAYERAAGRELSDDLHVMLERNLTDERRHRAWLMQRLGIREELPQH